MDELQKQLANLFYQRGDVSTHIDDCLAKLEEIKTAIANVRRTIAQLTPAEPVVEPAAAKPPKKR
jgi:hypothetical protein